MFPIDAGLYLTSHISGSLLTTVSTRLTSDSNLQLFPSLNKQQSVWDGTAFHDSGALRTKGQERIPVQEVLKCSGSAALGKESSQAFRTEE